MGRKTPISFYFRKYVEKQWPVVSAQENMKTVKASYNTDYIVPDLIDFFGDDLKETKMHIEKRNIYICKTYCTD